MKALRHPLTLAILVMLFSSCFSSQGTLYSQGYDDYGYYNNYDNEDYDDYYGNNRGISFNVFYNELRPPPADGSTMADMGRVLGSECWKKFSSLRNQRILGDDRLRQHLGYLNTRGAGHLSIMGDGITTITTDGHGFPVMNGHLPG